MTPKPKPPRDRAPGARKKAKRKRGAQPGNKNAERHGFYSKSFTPDESSRLDAFGADLSLIAEINLNKVMIDRLQSEISFAIKTISDSNGNSLRDDHYLRQLSTLAAMTAAQASLVRTQYLVKGKAGDVQQSILAALEELRLEMGI